MTQLEYATQVDAPPERVWAAMIDVERWPEFAAQFSRIRRTDEGPLALGRSARVSLRGFIGSVWTVTEYTQERSFVWEADALPGLHLLAGHSVEPEGEGSRLRLWLRSSGPLAAPLAPIASRIFRRNLRFEGEGMKAFCERQSR